MNFCIHLENLDFERSSREAWGLLSRLSLLEPSHHNEQHSVAHCENFRGPKRSRESSKSRENSRHLTLQPDRDTVLPTLPLP
ncbi:hypothetical protein JTB14_003378 [Gonioctena quinquepunctata]|nr:hypothetical protein JTB14_003378 [Gonioctena quinquepunctata]